MDKLLTRITIVLVSIYFIVSYILAQFAGVDILRYSYTLLFEACVAAYTFSSGHFHCRFIRWTALSILLCDIVSHTDYYFDYIPICAFNFILMFILISGVTTSITLAIRHFTRVIKLRNERERLISNQKVGNSLA